MKVIYLHAKKETNKQINKQKQRTFKGIEVRRAILRSSRINERLKALTLKLAYNI